MSDELWRQMPSMHDWPDGPISVNGYDLDDERRLRLEKKDKAGPRAFVDGVPVAPGAVIKKGPMIIHIEPDQP